MNCRESIELQPWLLNGSLEAGERAELLAHLRTCRSCRSELRDTLSAWETLDVHVPSWDLAAYGHDEPPAIWSREHLERHLARCPQCRLELELVRGAVTCGTERGDGSTRVVVVPMIAAAARAVRPPRWTRLPLAAAVAFALLGYGLLRLGSGLSHPGETPSPAEVGEIASAAGDSAPTSSIDAAVFTDGFESGHMAHWSMVTVYPIARQPGAGPERSAHGPGRKRRDIR